MQAYNDLLKTILQKGELRNDRTGVGTLSIFGYQMRFDLSKGFPLLTTKKIHFKSVLGELLWFLKGESNIKFLKDNNISIWNDWADKDGELGKIYGIQWTRWKGANGKIYNQIQDVIHQIKTNPYSRRLIVSAWNVAELEDMNLPPCHLLFQFYVSNDNKLSCQLYQRSADVFLGVPFNIASYALLIHMIARVCDLEVGEFIHTIGDAHLYTNHIEQANLLLSRNEKELPTIRLNPEIKNVFDFGFKDVELLNYNPHDTIKASVAV